MPNLLDRLKGGDRRSVGEGYDVAVEILASASEDGARSLLEIADGMGSDDVILRSRCAHVLASVSAERPDLLTPFQDEILDCWAPIAQWEVREQMSKVLPRLSWTPDRLGQIYGLLQDYLEDRSSIVRTCALQAMVDLLDQAPERRPEVVRTVETLTESGTAAMRARGRKLLKVLSG